MQYYVYCIYEEKKIIYIMHNLIVYNRKQYRNIICIQYFGKKKISLSHFGVSVGNSDNIRGAILSICKFIIHDRLIGWK